MTTVYLAGPINGCNDDEAHGWRQQFMESLPGLEFLDPMRRDYRGIEDIVSADYIVWADRDDIEACDVFLANCWQASWGTAMEIVYAMAADKPVIAVVPEGRPVSPWLRYHAQFIVPTLAEARDALLREPLFRASQGSNG